MISDEEVDLHLRYAAAATPIPAREYLLMIVLIAATAGIWALFRLLVSVVAYGYRYENDQPFGVAQLWCGFWTGHHGPAYIPGPYVMVGRCVHCGFHWIGGE